MWSLVTRSVTGGGIKVECDTRTSLVPAKLKFGNENWGDFALYMSVSVLRVHNSTTSAPNSELCSTVLHPAQNMQHTTLRRLRGTTHVTRVCQIRVQKGATGATPLLDVRAISRRNRGCRAHLTPGRGGWAWFRGPRPRCCLRLGHGLHNILLGVGASFHMGLRDISDDLVLPVVQVRPPASHCIVDLLSHEHHPRPAVAAPPTHQRNECTSNAQTS